MTARTYRTQLRREGPMCAIPVPFDPREVFGKARAPVTVTIDGYSYRSTIAPVSLVKEQTRKFAS